MTLNPEILLCFSEDDNQPIDGGLKGWVSNFHKFLSTLIAQISKDESGIKMISGSGLDTVDVERAEVIILITTRNLVKHQMFMEKVNDLAVKARRRDDLRVNGVARIFKVNKSPFDIDDHLTALSDLIAYDFFLVDPLSGQAQEFKRFFGTEAERSYWMKLVDMAYDIHQVISNKANVVETEAFSYEREKTVYLASTGIDMVIQRDIIKRELIRHGYNVLPQHSLPKEVYALESMVKKDLEKCRLSIHMVGEDYGYRPKGSELSIVDIQNRLASNHTYEMVEFNKNNIEKKPFSRLIWVSPDLKNITERQKIFIEDLKSDAAALEEAEVLQITLPELKSIVREELMTGGRFNTFGHLESTGDEEDNDSQIIYLITDKNDRSDSSTIIEFLENKGFKVVLPSFDGDLVDIRFVHQENLRRCDASIIYFGKSSEAWMRTKLQDLLKAPGFGRDKRLLAKAIYCDGPKDIDQSLLQRNNAFVLGNNGGFKPEHLKPFLTKLENGLS